MGQTPKIYELIAHVPFETCEACAQMKQDGELFGSN